jgi:hypothetical protein
MPIYNLYFPSDTLFTTKRHILIKYHNKKLLNKIKIKNNNKIFKINLLVLKDILIKYHNEKLKLVSYSTTTKRHLNKNIIIKNLSWSRRQNYDESRKLFQ